MAKKAKKKRAHDTPTKADVENYNFGIEHVRAYLERGDKGFWELEECFGIHKFLGMYEAEDGVVSHLVWSMVVHFGGVSLVCYIPLRVPKPRRDAVVRFVNQVNEEQDIRGALSINVKNGDVSYRCDLPVAAIKGDPDNAIDDFVLTVLPTAAIYANSLLEVIIDSSLPESEDTDESEDTAESDEHAKDEAGKNGRSGGAKRGKKSDAVMSKPTPEYSLDGLGVRSEVPLGRIVAAVARFHKTHRSSEVVPRLSILISGPSGCGKTEFVKYLGERTGTEVIAVTASDVLRSLVGETEQRIADVFREASEKHAILFLDEVDSLLFNRKNAHYAWERVQTNELLQQMERFTGVLVCATNLVEQLDSAVMRRFTFKVQMSALDDDGKLKFFSRYFKSNLTAEERRRLLAIPNLTPGDFRTVRERLYFLRKNRGVDNARRIAALEVESKAKEASRMPIGFG